MCNCLHHYMIFHFDISASRWLILHTQKKNLTFSFGVQNAWKYSNLHEIHLKNRFSRWCLDQGHWCCHSHATSTLSLYLQRSVVRWIFTMEHIFFSLTRLQIPKALKLFVNVLLHFVIVSRNLLLYYHAQIYSPDPFGSIHRIGIFNFAVSMTPCSVLTENILSHINRWRLIILIRCFSNLCILSFSIFIAPNVCILFFIFWKNHRMKYSLMLKICHYDFCHPNIGTLECVMICQKMTNGIHSDAISNWIFHERASRISVMECAFSLNQCQWHFL